MIPTGQPPAVALRRMTTAYWTSQVIYLAATLGIPDILADQPQTSEALAVATGTHAPSLYRLLRAVASLGILEEDEARRFSLTPRGTLLRSDVPGSMRAWAILLGEPWFRSAWDNLPLSWSKTPSVRPLLVLRGTDEERERDLRWRVGRLCS